MFMTQFDSLFWKLIVINEFAHVVLLMVNGESLSFKIVE